MILERQGQITFVRLSRRNLEELARRLGNGDDSSCVRRTADGVLVVVVEENEQHYGAREPGPVPSA